MQWIKDNYQLVGFVGTALVWLVTNFGPTIYRKALTVLRSLSPKVQSGTTILSAWPLIAAALLLAPSLMPATPVPVEPPRAPDLFDRCATSGRALLAEELLKIASQKFDSDAAKEEAINLRILDVVDSSYEPLHIQIAAACKANRLSDFAGKLKSGELYD